MKCYFEMVESGKAEYGLIENSVMQECSMESTEIR